ncbi:hypothetical protein PILCRDRAFT_91365 [Piloderma croceum F 1598]|uniref:Uncharacterized protein n=1 Tax=Piloderma croceum (strain F 1598) TaxID=765440 RepID=A0A0C3EWG5_PILCF|nr:hypothetical protein PILCRDRAFT_91365 [Piloderma croceum F 1598]
MYDRGHQQDLKNREWQVEQLESDKTIVEHMFTFSKKLSKELQKNAAYTRSLEKSKARLAGEAEGLTRETERERMELRAKEEAAKAQEKAANEMADIMKGTTGQRGSRIGIP